LGPSLIVDSPSILAEKFFLARPLGGGLPPYLSTPVRVLTSQKHVRTSVTRRKYFIVAESFQPLSNYYELYFIKRIL